MCDSLLSSEPIYTLMEKDQLRVPFVLKDVHLQVKKEGWKEKAEPERSNNDVKAAELKTNRSQLI